MTVIVTTAITLLVNFLYKVFAGGIKSGTVTQRLGSIENAIIAIQIDLKQMTGILVDLASVRGDIRSLANRTERNEQDIRELRHGRGFVQEEIKGEYPRT